MQLHLLDRFNRRTRADVIVTAQDVVLKMSSEIIGRFPRREIQAWLRRPTGEIDNGRVILMAVPNGVALSVADEVPMWPLTDSALDRLRTILASEDIETLR